MPPFWPQTPRPGIQRYDAAHSMPNPSTIRVNPGRHRSRPPLADRVLVTRDFGTVCSPDERAPRESRARSCLMPGCGWKGCALTRFVAARDVPASRAHEAMPAGGSDVRAEGRYAGFAWGCKALREKRDERRAGTGTGTGTTRPDETRLGGRDRHRTEPRALIGRVRAMRPRRSPRWRWPFR